MLVLVCSALLLPRALLMTTVLLTLALWPGGPGCSSVGEGLWMEHGPYQVSNSRPGVQPNPYSWNRAANMYVPLHCSQSSLVGSHSLITARCRLSVRRLPRCRLSRGFSTLFLWCRLYLEHPVGVGFSYSEHPDDYVRTPTAVHCSVVAVQRPSCSSCSLSCCPCLCLSCCTCLTSSIHRPNWMISKKLKVSSKVSKLSVLNSHNLLPTKRLGSG